MEKWDIFLWSQVEEEIPGSFDDPSRSEVESAALRHLFLSERLAQKVPGVDEKPMPLKKIGILGAGLSLWPICLKKVKVFVIWDKGR